MKEETKYIIAFIISIILFGITLAIYFVDGKFTFLILSIIAIIASVGSLISYSMEHKENKYVNRKRKTKKRK